MSDDPFVLDEDYGMDPVVTDADVARLERTLSEVTQDAVLRTSATEELTRQLVDRLEYELEGAWRAGFDFLYVVTYNDIAGYDDSDFEAFTVKRSYIPSNNPDRRPPEPMATMERYDLRGVTTAEIREAKHDRN